MRIGPQTTHGLLIALPIIVMASALALAFGYGQLPNHASANKIARTLDANGNGVVTSR